MSPSTLLYSALHALTFFLALTTAAPTSTLKLSSRDLTFDYDNDKVMGVNLGGWFVLEPWITPSIFEEAGDSVVDEYTLCQTLGYDAAYSVLSNHWSTWITESDFWQIQAAGLNHVRIPIGYWSVSPIDGDPYVQGALDFMDLAVQWARNAGLKVILDLHGAPGSQNGFDNSGHRGAINWGTGDTVEQTLTTIHTLATHYSGDTDVVTVIEVLNEPLGDINTITYYYYNAYGNVREVDGDTVVAVHDAFRGPEYWNSFNPGWHTMIDTHFYQIFDTPQLQQTPDEFFSSACAQAPGIAGTSLWTIVGEWSGALTDCAMWLNGRGLGARYDGTLPGNPYIGSCDGKSSGTVDGLSAADKYNIRRYNEAQLDAFVVRTGWVFWTWKTEGAPEWDMQAQLAGGLFPQPLSDRQYPGQCN